MSLPFTPREFLAVFSRYNDAAWPTPVVLALLAAATLVVAAADSAGYQPMEMSASAAQAVPAAATP